MSAWVGCVVACVSLALQLCGLHKIEDAWAAWCRCGLQWTLDAYIDINTCWGALFVHLTILRPPLLQELRRPGLG